MASLTRKLQPEQFEHLGPHFAFILWVCARSLIILRTTGHECNSDSFAGDLEALMCGLQNLAQYWPSAGRYRDLIRHIQDTKDSPDGAAGLNIFNDTRRTAHGLEKALGELSRKNDVDFLDLPFLDNEDFADPTLPWMSSFDMDHTQEWIA